MLLRVISKCIDKGYAVKEASSRLDGLSASYVAIMEEMENDFAYDQFLVISYTVHYFLAHLRLC